MKPYRTACCIVLFSVLFSTCEQPSPTAEANPASAAIHWQEPLTIATGKAQAGPWRMNETELHYVDDPTVALRDDGVLAIAWVDNEHQELFSQRYDAEARPQTEAINVSRSPDIFSWLPRILFTADNHVYVLWQEIVFSGGSHGGEIFFARSEDGGNSFSKPRNLSATIAGAGKGRLSEHQWDNGSLDFILGPAGEIFVAWTEYEGALRFRRSLDGGRSFSDTIHVNGSDQQPARGPTLAIAPTGRLYVAWAVGKNESADIHLTTSDDRGQSFAATRITHHSEGQADTPGLAVDAEGRVHLVYAERPMEASEYFHVFYLTLNEAGEAASEPRALSPYPAENEGAQAPVIRVDSESRLYVVWEHHSDPSRFARGMGYAFSPDAGQTFTEPAMLPGSRGNSGAVNGSLQGQLTQKLSVNDRAELAVVNSHFRLGDKSRIVLIRGKVGDD